MAELLPPWHLQIDVESREARVLASAQRLLRGGHVRNIVFEYNPALMRPGVLVCGGVGSGTTQQTRLQI